MTLCRLLKPVLRVISRGENTGVAALEFAIYATLFLTVFAVTADLALSMYYQFQMDSAVAAGAEYAALNAASVNSTSGAGLASSISNVVANANGSAWEDGTIVINNGPAVTVTGGSPVASGTASNADNCYCPTGTPPNWSWGGSVTCGSACTGSTIAGKFVTIAASRSFTALFPQLGFTQNGTITRSALVQTQ